MAGQEVMQGLGRAEVRQGARMAGQGGGFPLEADRQEVFQDLT